MKPEKARGVEDVILRAAQMGQIVEKVLCVHAYYVPNHIYIDSTIYICMYIAGGANCNFQF